MGRAQSLLGVVAVCLLCALATAVSPAAASVTIGQVGTPLPDVCENGTDLMQPTVTSGGSYVVPGTGTITSWTTHGGSINGLLLTMKVFRLVAPPATYQAVGHSGPHAVAANGTAGNTFPANIPVRPGDVLGLDGGSQCLLGVLDERYWFYAGDLADGAQGEFKAAAPGRRLNIQATFVPANSLVTSQIKRNTRNGTALATFSVPNPGDMTGSGGGAKVSADLAVSSKTVSAGPAKLKIRAKGKKLKILNQTGKVKVKPTITYTPTGGDPKTLKLKVKLLKRTG